MKKTNKKSVLDNYVCEHQLSFRTIDMEIKEDEEWDAFASAPNSDE